MGRLGPASSPTTPAQGVGAGRRSAAASWLWIVDLERGVAVAADTVPSALEIPLAAAGFSATPMLVEALGALAQGLKRWPWLAPCLGVLPQHRHLVTSLPAVVRFHHRLAWCVVDTIGAPPTPTSVWGAIRRRRAPSPADMAAYVAHRLRCGHLRLPLREQFAVAMTGNPADIPRSPATYSRLFARHGPFTARDWRGVACLCLLAGGVAVPRGPLAPRAQFRLCRRYLGLPGPVVRHQLAWEHLLEVALRRSGYLGPLGTPGSQRRQLAPDRTV
jgi:hypothetical protein